MKRATVREYGYAFLFSPFVCPALATTSCLGLLIEGSPLTPGETTFPEAHVGRVRLYPTPGPSAPPVISFFDANTGAGPVTLMWDSENNVFYNILSAPDLVAGPWVTNAIIAGDGSTSGPTYRWVVASSSCASKRIKRDPSATHAIRFGIAVRGQEKSSGDSLCRQCCMGNFCFKTIGFRRCLEKVCIEWECAGSAGG